MRLHMYVSAVALVVAASSVESFVGDSGAYSYSKTSVGSFGVAPHRKNINNGQSTSTALRLNLGKEIKEFLGIGGQKYAEPCVMGEETIMSPKAHGTSATPVQENLKYGVDRSKADQICNFNRHYAEHRGYWTKTKFFEEAKAEYEEKGEVTFYDSNTGKALFVVPAREGRTFQDFIKETLTHGWPSFRDEECIWDEVRVLNDGETVSLDGTHLGHNLPDSTGNRYCINLVSIAGSPVENES
mmetsp:Transcript_24715/g.54652  ORF Transcript_24715/g.54652 Transcript_24715/m.54652 type:complete len:242 (-) Transcript_24715:792-1517(-)